MARRGQARRAPGPQALEPRKYERRTYIAGIIEEDPALPHPRPEAADMAVARSRATICPWVGSFLVRARITFLDSGYMDHESMLRPMPLQEIVVEPLPPVLTDARELLALRDPLRVPVPGRRHARRELAMDQALALLRRKRMVFPQVCMSAKPAKSRRRLRETPRPPTQIP